MKLIYGIKDKPKFGKLIVFAFQQLLAIMAATIAVPMITSGVYNCGEVQMSTVAALFGAGAGTLVYVLFTKAKSPVFLGSSFAFLGSMAAAFAGATTVALGYLGLILGAVFAGLVYVVIAIAVKISGVGWINKLMPAAVIGPTVAIIGLSLAGNAIGDLQKGSYAVNGEPTASVYVAIICGLVTLFVTMFCSVFGKKMVKLIRSSSASSPATLSRLSSPSSASRPETTLLELSTSAASLHSLLTAWESKPLFRYPISPSSRLSAPSANSTVLT